MEFGKLIYGSSSEMPDIFYASGFNCIDPFIYFSCGSIRAVVVPALEYSRAVKEVKKGIEVFERREFAGQSPSAKDSLRDVLEGILKRYRPEIWLVPAKIPHIVAGYMINAGASLNCVESDFFIERRRKSPEEIMLIAASLKTAEKAMKIAKGIISDSSIDRQRRLIYEKKPLSSEFLKIQINLELIRHGGIATGTIASSGIQSSAPHDTGSGLIIAGTPIVIDIFPKNEISGYWGDITRTFVKGKAPKIVKKAYFAVREARDFSISKVKDGAIPSEISKSATEILCAHGFETGKKDGTNYGFFHSLGHGVGLDIHENPRLSPSNSTPLEEGNVITVEPGLYYPEWGGVRLEDLVVVGSGEKCTNLSEFPDCLEIE